MEKIDILETVDFFKGVSRKSRQALADICMPKSLRKNDCLFSEGDNGLALFILITGMIRVFKSGPGGKDTTIKVIRPGELFAEVILFEQNVYPVSATALKASVVYELPKQRFFSLLDASDFRNDFILMLMKKQRYLAERLHSLSSFDVEERFIRFLEEHYGKKNDYYIALTKKDIASAIGATPETFSRLIGRMRQEGKLSMKGKSISIEKGFWSNRKLAEEAAA